MTIHAALIYLRSPDAAAAIAFYAEAFGAEEVYRLAEPSGRIGHAELRVGPATILISDAFPEWDIPATDPNEAPRFAMHLHVEDADAQIARAVAAGATLLREPADQFYGERSGKVRDPFGVDWDIGHEIEALSPAEMQRRYDALLAG